MQVIVPEYMHDKIGEVIKLNMQAVELGANRLHMSDKISEELGQSNQKAFEFVLWQALHDREAFLRERISSLGGER
ncbi:hypothetical protein [Gracilibacillus timonensis]|uniref:hypothetical protein n=1 Tax=Gracilibacillus timonensis TaxID=1816696 RepID=UPI000824DD26|nr:hypothetical protein [Gracilibacillus timonensis]